MVYSQYGRWHCPGCNAVLDLGGDGVPFVERLTIPGRSTRVIVCVRGEEVHRCGGEHDALRVVARHGTRSRWA